MSYYTPRQAPSDNKHSLKESQLKSLRIQSSMNKYIRHLRKTVSSNEEKLECDILKLTTAILNFSCNKQTWDCGGRLCSVWGEGGGGGGGDARGLNPTGPKIFLGGKKK